MSRIWRTLFALLLICHPLSARADDLAEIMSAHSAKATRIEEKIREKMSKLNRSTIKQLQDLQDTYTRAAKLDEALAVRDQIRALQAASDRTPVESTTPIAYPAMGFPPYELRGQLGRSFTRQVTGSTTGYVWGTGVYTSDSDLGTAAVHAGFLQVGETADVTFTMLAGQSHYQGSTSHDVTSHDWSTWDGSFRIDRATNKIRSCPRSSANVQPDPGSLFNMSAADGQTLYFDVMGSNNGALWGSDVYTTDSTLAMAAVHAGVLSVGQRGVIKVTILPGRSAYAASNRHGVQSSSWSSYPASMRIEPAR